MSAKVAIFLVYSRNTAKGYYIKNPCTVKVAGILILLFVGITS